MMTAESVCVFANKWPPLCPNQLFEAGDLSKLPLAPGWKLLLGADASPTRGFAVLSGHKTVVTLLEDVVLPKGWASGSTAAKDAAATPALGDAASAGVGDFLLDSVSLGAATPAIVDAPAEAVRHFGSGECVRRRVLLRNDAGAVYGYAVSWWSVDGYRRVMADASRPIGGNMANARLEVHRDISQVYRCCAASAPPDLAAALGLDGKHRCIDDSCGCECSAARRVACKSAVAADADVAAAVNSSCGSDGRADALPAGDARPGASACSGAAGCRCETAGGSCAGGEGRGDSALSSRPPVCDRCAVWGRHYVMWNGGAPLAVICEIFSPACQSVLGPYQLLTK